MSKQDVQHNILTVAERLIQLNGYNAFSYRDIAAEVGVKTSSIHYHFPTKADLAVAVIEHHQCQFMQNLENLMHNTRLKSKTKLEHFLNAIFESTYLTERKMCLGGILASDVLTLPEKVQKAVQTFFNYLTNWLQQLLQEGIKQHEFKSIVEIKSEAQMIVMEIEGALLLARLYQDEKRLAKAKKAIVARLC